MGQIPLISQVAVHPKHSGTASRPSCVKAKPWPVGRRGPFLVKGRISTPSGTRLAQNRSVAVLIPSLFRVCL